MKKCIRTVLCVRNFLNAISVLISLHIPIFSGNNLSFFEISDDDLLEYESPLSPEVKHQLAMLQQKDQKRLIELQNTKKIYEYAQQLIRAKQEGLTLNILFVEKVEDFASKLHFSNIETDSDRPHKMKAATSIAHFLFMNHSAKHVSRLAYNQRKERGVKDILCADVPGKKCWEYMGVFIGLISKPEVMARCVTNQFYFDTCLTLRRFTNDVLRKYSDDLDITKWHSFAKKFFNMHEYVSTNLELKKK